MQLNLGDVLSKATILAGGRTEWPLSECSFWANIAGPQGAELSARELHELADRYEATQPSTPMITKKTAM